MIERKNGEVWYWSEDGRLLIRASEKDFEYMQRERSKKLGEQIDARLADAASGLCFDCRTEPCSCPVVTTEQP